MSVGGQSVRPGTPSLTVAEPQRHRLDRHTPPDLNFTVPHKKQHRSGLAW